MRVILADIKWTDRKLVIKEGWRDLTGVRDIWEGFVDEVQVIEDDQEIGGEWVIVELIFFDLLEPIFEIKM